jgi:hypothetical protein
MCGGGLLIEAYGLPKVGAYCDTPLARGDSTGEGIPVGPAPIGGAIMTGGANALPVL